MKNQPTRSTETIADQLSEIQETAEKEKVQLTTEVQEYIGKAVTALQDKLADEEPTVEEDVEFIKEVRMWMGMPEEWREKYPSIEGMKGLEEMEEARKRDISLRQWLDLLHVAEVAGWERKQIDKNL